MVRTGLYRLYQLSQCLGPVCLTESLGRPASHGRLWPFCPFVGGFVVVVIVGAASKLLVFITRAGTTVGLAESPLLSPWTRGGGGNLLLLGLRLLDRGWRCHLVFRFTLPPSLSLLLLSSLLGRALCCFLRFLLLLLLHYLSVGQLLT